MSSAHLAPADVAGLLRPLASAAGLGARPRRLLFVVNDARFFVSHRLPLALAARAQGYDVHLAAMADDAVETVRAHGLPFHPLLVDRTGTTPANDLRTLIQLATMVRELAPTILHGVTIKGVIYGGLVARALGVPGFVGAVSGLGQVFAPGGPGLRLARRVSCRLYRAAFAHRNSRIIFQNPDDLDEFVGSGLLPPGRSVLIHGSGVDPTVYAASPEPAGTPVVLLAGRLLWAKGVEEFVDAARAMRAAGHAARFVIAGTPPAHNRDAVPVERLLAWQDEGVVEWWGYRPDMPAVYARSHIVCLPSYYREGIPKGLIEAASCGRPIVTTDTPGCRIICRHGRNGLLVPPRKGSALVAAIAALVADPARRRAMGVAGQALAATEFSLASVIDKTLAVYRTLEAGFGETKRRHPA